MLSNKSSASYPENNSNNNSNSNAVSAVSGMSNAPKPDHTHVNMNITQATNPGDTVPGIPGKTNIPDPGSTSAQPNNGRYDPSDASTATTSCPAQSEDGRNSGADSRGVMAMTTSNLTTDVGGGPVAPPGPLHDATALNLHPANSNMNLTSASMGGQTVSGANSNMNLTSASVGGQTVSGEPSSPRRTPDVTTSSTNSHANSTSSLTANLTISNISNLTSGGQNTASTQVLEARRRIGLEALETLARHLAPLLDKVIACKVCVYSMCVYVYGMYVFMVCVCLLFYVCVCSVSSVCMRIYIYIYIYIYTHTHTYINVCLTGET
jgi:hypothetical protein